MIPAGFADVEAQLWLWLLAMIRPGAALFAAPVMGAATVPVRLRLVIALAIGIAALNSAPFALPADGLTSVAGFAMIGGEIVIGLALGFTIQIGYAAALLAGEVISNAMGLGFASMVDPQSGQSTPVIGQLLGIFATLIFLSMDGHLALIRLVIDSYSALPPGGAIMHDEALFGLVNFGGVLFSLGLLIALPVASALILVQIIMGMVARAAPALNLFAVGLPATLLAGILLLSIASPVLIEGISLGLDQSLTAAADIIR
ncbi:MAG: flagellar biosynthetic protein FliR [Parasphingorhabdus sp.]|nr:flagellar biosynthetic protein FliR [Parasphingorhabdus sp.]